MTVSILGIKYYSDMELMKQYHEATFQEDELSLYDEKKIKA